MKLHEKVLLGFIICLLVFLVVMISMHNQKTHLNEPVTRDSTNCSFVDSTTIESYKDIVEKKPQVITWNKSEDIDEMTDKKIRYAWLKSMNYVNLDFPYRGDTYMKMTIREKGSTDVYFRIDRGQILCSEYSGTDNVYIRFDNDPPIRFRTVEASSGSSDIVFLSGNVKKFISRCRKAKEIKVQIPIYEYGNAVFDFYVNTPLEW